jgi:hypothetical protein
MRGTRRILKNHVLIIVLMVMHDNLHLLCLRADAYHRGIVGGSFVTKQIDNICADSSYVTFATRMENSSITKEC